MRAPDLNPPCPDLEQFIYCNALQERIAAKPLATHWRKPTMRLKRPHKLSFAPKRITTATYNCCPHEGHSTWKYTAIAINPALQIASHASLQIEHLRMRLVSAEIDSEVH